MATALPINVLRGLAAGASGVSRHRNVIGAESGKEERLLEEVRGHSDHRDRDRCRGPLVERVADDTKPVMDGLLQTVMGNIAHVATYSACGAACFIRVRNQ